jgi:hypothetical protein
LIDIEDPTNEEFTNAAMLLMACDIALGDSLSPPLALAHAHRIYLSLEKEPWKDGKHSGDCTKTPYTCSRCMVEEYEAEVRKRYTT